MFSTFSELFWLSAYLKFFRFLHDLTNLIKHINVFDFSGDSENLHDSPTCLQNAIKKSILLQTVLMDLFNKGNLFSADYGQMDWI